MKNAVVIYKSENPINGWCYKSIKSTKWDAQSTKCIQNVNPTLGVVKCAYKWQKLVQKHKKRVEHLHGHPPKLERAKMEVGKEWRRRSAVGACQET